MIREKPVDGFKSFVILCKGNVKQFATAMQVLIADKDMRERLSQNALRWSQNFDWNKSADEFYRLIGRTIAGQSGIRPVVGEVFAGER